MRKFKKIAFNKYLLAGTAFLVWWVFFDQNNLILQIKKRSELNQLRKSEQVMNAQIDATKEELKLLKTNPATLERYAREKYLMKKENEDLFIISTDSSLIK